MTWASATKKYIKFLIKFLSNYHYYRTLIFKTYMNTNTFDWPDNDRYKKRKNYIHQ